MRMLEHFDATFSRHYIGAMEHIGSRVRRLALLAVVTAAVSAGAPQWTLAQVGGQGSPDATPQRPESQQQPPQGRSAGHARTSHSQVVALVRTHSPVGPPRDAPSEHRAMAPLGRGPQSAGAQGALAGSSTGGAAPPQDATHEIKSNESSRLGFMAG